MVSTAIISAVCGVGDARLRGAARRADDFFACGRAERFAEALAEVRFLPRDDAALRAALLREDFLLEEALRAREVADLDRAAPVFFFAVDFFAFERLFAEREEVRFFAAAIMPPLKIEKSSLTVFLRA